MKNGSEKKKIKLKLINQNDSKIHFKNGFDKSFIIEKRISRASKSKSSNRSTRHRRDRKKHRFQY